MLPSVSRDYLDHSLLACGHDLESTVSSTVDTLPAQHWSDHHTLTLTPTPWCFLCFASADHLPDVIHHQGSFPLGNLTRRQKTKIERITHDWLNGYVESSCSSVCRESRWLFFTEQKDNSSVLFPLGGAVLLVRYDDVYGEDVCYPIGKDSNAKRDKKKAYRIQWSHTYPYCCSWGQILAVTEVS